MNFEKWERLRLGEHCQKIGSGATPRGGQENYKTDGISLIRSQNILDFTFSKNGLAFIDDNQAKELSNVEVKESDVLLNITGDSVARVCQVPKDVLPARVNQHVAIIRPNGDVLDPYFLKYYLLNPKTKEFLLGLGSSGATRNALTKAMIENLEIVAPTVTAQRRIAAILTALDDKVELNRRMNETLEGIAQAVWGEWFGKEDTSDLIELGEVVDFNPRVSITQEEEVVYVEMRDVPERGMCISGFVKKPFTNGSKFQMHDTLLARITPCLENGKTAFVNFLKPGEKAFGSTEFIVMRAKEGISPFYVYLVAREERFRQFAIGSMVGSSGRQRVQSEILPSFEVAIFDIKKMAKFHAFAKPIFEEIFLNFQQSQTLTALRDALLPRLMRGEGLNKIFVN